MNLQQLLLEIERMYAAVGSATEPDLSKFPPTFDVAEQSVMVRQDFNASAHDQTAEARNALLFRWSAIQKNSVVPNEEIVQQASEGISYAENAPDLARRRCRRSSRERLWWYSGQHG
jgi:hypothetical protein